MDIIIRLAVLQYMVTQAVMKCPMTIADWNISSMALQCKKPNYYHCLRDESGNIAQQCLERVWIQNGMCPEYNSKAQRIDVYDCKSHQNNCPTATFWSNAVYVYPGCFSTSDATSTASQPAITSTYYDTSGFEILKKDTETSKDNESDNTTVFILVAVCAAVLIFILSAVFIWWKRGRRSNRDPNFLADSGLTNDRAGNTEHIEETETNEMLDDANKINAFTFPVMITNITTTKDGASTNDTSTFEKTSNALPIITIIIIICCIIVRVLLVLSVGYIVYRRRRRKASTELRERINNGREKTENQSSEEEKMLKGNSNNPSLKTEDDSTSLDVQINDLVEKIKENKEKKKRIIFIPSYATVDETKIAEAAGMLGENASAANGFNKWMKNKSEGLYVFRDWVLSDQEISIEELKRTLIEVLHTVINNESKFIILFPLSIWGKDQNLAEILRNCPLCKIMY